MTPTSTDTPMHRLGAALTTWPFIASLAVLIVNDGWLKSAWPGVITGKLSDVAGVAIVGLLLRAVWPRRPWRVFVGVALGFAWWKSTLSQPAIDAINTWLPSPIGRTVDATDLAALLVLPLCGGVTSRPSAFAVPGRVLRRLLLGPIVALTALALTATSFVQTRQAYEVRRTADGTGFDRAAVAATVAEVASQYGLKCEECADPQGGARYRGSGMWLRYAFVGARSIAFNVEAFPDGMFFGASGAQKADGLRSALKSRLAAQHKDLEYVESLAPPAGDAR